MSPVAEDLDLIQCLRNKVALGGKRSYALQHVQMVGVPRGIGGKVRNRGEHREGSIA